MHFESSVYVTALSDWLPALGYAYNNLVPPIVSDITDAGAERLGHVTVTSLIDDTVSVGVRAYLFGAGVIIRTTTMSDCQRVTVDVLRDTHLSQLAVVLLNNSIFVTTYYSPSDQRQVHHYVKPSSSPHHLYDVINTTNSDVINFSGGVTLTVSHLSRHDVIISVSNDVTQLRVRHMTSRDVDLTAERQHIVMTSHQQS